MNSSYDKIINGIFYMRLGFILIGSAYILAFIGFSLASNAQDMVSPDEFHHAIAAAEPGQQITLIGGNFGQVKISNLSFSQPVLIDARQATFSGITIQNSQGIKFMGGEISAPLTQNFGILIRSSGNITISGMKITGSRIGLSINQGHDVRVEENVFDSVRSDGINVAGSQRVLINRNICRNFQPIPAIYDKAGKLVTDGDHPDCIQGWSITGIPPTADVTITENHARGVMQGIFFSDAGHQGGYDRMIVRGNDLMIGMFQGINLTEARDSEVSGNTVLSTPDARMPNFPFRKVIPWIWVTGERNKVCGNRVQDHRGGADRKC